MITDTIIPWIVKWSLLSVLLDMRLILLCTLYNEFQVTLFHNINDFC